MPSSQLGPDLDLPLHSPLLDPLLSWTAVTYRLSIPQLPFRDYDILVSVHFSIYTSVGDFRIYR